MHAAEDVALERRLKRDFIERGYDGEDLLYNWPDHVVPAYQEVLLPYRDQYDPSLDTNSNRADEIVAARGDISAYLRKAFFYSCISGISPSTISLPAVASCICSTDTPGARSLTTKAARSWSISYTPSSVTTLLIQRLPVSGKLHRESS